MWPHALHSFEEPRFDRGEMTHFILPINSPHVYGIYPKQKDIQTATNIFYRILSREYIQNIFVLGNPRRRDLVDLGFTKTINKNTGARFSNFWRKQGYTTQDAYLYRVERV